MNDDDTLEPTATFISNCCGALPEEELYLEYNGEITGRCSQCGDMAVFLQEPEEE